MQDRVRSLSRNFFISTTRFLVLAFAFAFILLATVRLDAQSCPKPVAPAFATPANVCAGSTGNVATITNPEAGTV
jgi:hypothetical protein